MVGLNLAPKVKLIRKVTKQVIGLLEPLPNIVCFEDTLKLVLVHVDQELIRVNILRH